MFFFKLARPQLFKEYDNSDYFSLTPQPWSVHIYLDPRLPRPHWRHSAIQPRLLPQGLLRRN